MEAFERTKYLAIQEAERLGLEAGCIGSEVNLGAIAKRLEVREIVPAPLRAEGCLVRLEDGAFRISYRQDRPRPRRRFTVAHELAHIIVARIAGPDIPGRLERNPQDYSEVEKLADRVAASLLMPSELFVDRLWNCCVYERRNRGSISNKKVVDELGRMFGVSVSAVVIRLFEIRSLMTFWACIPVDYQPPEDTRLRIRMSSHQPCESESRLAQRLLKESSIRRHQVDVSTPVAPCTLSCDGWVRPGIGKQSNVQQYWVVGWKWDSEVCSKISI